MVRTLGLAILCTLVLWVIPGCEVDCEVCCTFTETSSGDSGEECFTVDNVDKGACEDCSVGDDIENDVASGSGDYYTAKCSCEGK